MVSQLETHQGLTLGREICKLSTTQGGSTNKHKAPTPSCTSCPWLVLIQATEDFSWLRPETLDGTPGGSHNERGAGQPPPSASRGRHQALPGTKPVRPHLGGTLGTLSLRLPCPHRSQPLSMISLL